MRLPMILPLALATLAGCAAAPPLPEIPETQSLVPCMGRPEPVTEQWRQVIAVGFTFCVPATWRAESPDSPQARTSAAAGFRSWRGENGNVEWHLEGLSRERPVPMLTRAGPRPDYQSYFEDIDGSRVRISTIRDGLLHDIDASWPAPKIFLRGRVEGVDGAALLLTIVRSVRINPS